MKPNLFEMARDAGLPVSWWQKAIDEGETPEWRELEKFAEFIVKECAAQIAEAIPDTDCSASGAYKTAKIAAMARVKAHFGVE